MKSILLDEIKCRASLSTKCHLPFCFDFGFYPFVCVVVVTKLSVDSVLFPAFGSEEVKLHNVYSYKSLVYLDHIFLSWCFVLFFVCFVFLFCFCLFVCFFADNTVITVTAEVNH